MNLKETETLLREMFAIDGRHLDADKIKAWHNVVGKMPLDIAQRALRMARQDERIGYVEPKHIIGKAKEAAEAMDRQEQREKKQEPVKKGVAMPSCIHGEGLLYCDPCCNTLWVYQRDKLSHLANYVEPLHTYAKEHVIA